MSLYLDADECKNCGTFVLTDGSPVNSCDDHTEVL